MSDTNCDLFSITAAGYCTIAHQCQSVGCHNSNKSIISKGGLCFHPHLLVDWSVLTKLGGGMKQG